MKKSISLLISILLLQISFSQIKKDPRMVGMGGAYSTISTDYRCVGINPANLAFNKALSLNMIGFNVGGSNNMFSIETYNEWNGSNLDDIQADKYFEKNDIFSLSKKEGLRFNADFHLPIPGFNISKGIFAFTSDLILISDIGIPETFLDLIFNGISADTISSDIGKDYIFEFKEDIIGVNELAFSLGIPYDDFGLGISIKYLQGLFYLGIDGDSSYATLRVDSTEVVGNGRILLKQAIGGSGLGLDFGFATKRNSSGWKFGFSIINLFSEIQWNKSNFTRNLFSDNIEAVMPYRQNEYFLFGYEIEGVNAQSFIGSGSSMDSLFRTWSYPVISHPDSGLINSEKKSDEYLKEIKLSDFTTDYPTFFRLGLSKKITDQAITAFDISTGFSDNFTSYGNWKFSFGTEITRFKSIPFRFGYCFGGNKTSDLSYGFGYHLGPLNFDFGIVFKKGIKVQSSKGMEISLGVIWAG